MKEPNDDAKDRIIWEILVWAMEEDRQEMVAHRESLEKRLLQLKKKLIWWILAYFSFYALLLMGFATVVDALESYGLLVHLIAFLAMLILVVLSLYVYFWKVDLLKREKNSTRDAIREVDEKMMQFLEEKRS